jgi:hypothetical protein
MTTTFTTKEAQMPGREPQCTVWFQTTEGKITIEMSNDGLLQLHGLVSDAVTTMQTGNERTD